MSFRSFSFQSVSMHSVSPQFLLQVYLPVSLQVSLQVSVQVSLRVSLQFSLQVSVHYCSERPVHFLPRDALGDHTARLRRPGRVAFLLFQSSFCTSRVPSSVVPAVPPAHAAAPFLAVLSGSPAALVTGAAGRVPPFVESRWLSMRPKLHSSSSTIAHSCLHGVHTQFALISVGV